MDHPEQKNSQENNPGSGEGFIKKPQQKRPTYRNSSQTVNSIIKKILISIPYQIAITILTFYSLFADDIRIIAFEKTADIVFDGINIALIIIFFTQIVLSSLVIDKYFLSFYFVLDIISSLSLLFDISIFTDLIYSSSFSNYTFSQVAAQTKASRAAIRAVRIVKLARIIRIVKLYKAALKAEDFKDLRNKENELKLKLKAKYQKNAVKNQEEETLAKMNKTQYNARSSQKGNKKILPEQSIKKQNKQNKINFPHVSFDQQGNSISSKQQNQSDELLNTDLIEQVDKNQSKIRKVMADITLKKVIIVVLLLMFISPLFDSDIYLDSANSLDYTIGSLNNMLNKNVLTLTEINSVLNNVFEDHKDQDYYLIYFSSPFKQLLSYRHEEYLSYRVSDFISSKADIDTKKILQMRPELSKRTDFQDIIEETSILAILNNKSYNVYQSYLNIGKTLFICLLLIGLLHFFNNDIEGLIVQPIEKMMAKLKVIAEDPESASKQQIDVNGTLQTTVISNAIIKIGALLSIVFGSAGAQIIGKNILQQGDMNPMIEGKKKCAIFGFCDIRKFTEINQILEQDILQLVNKVSSVVHKAVHRYGGSANKNIGQAFLLVWKIPQGDYLINNENNQITWKNKEYLSILADYSVYSFIKTLVKINKLPEILQYKKNYKLLQKMPNFKIEMGFGLHIGWAIEGAIGSVYKIDASYLSPNVNMASRLEAATKQFGVTFLISESLYDVLTPELQNYCRNIDRVTVKGSNKPLKLYTVDMNFQNISPPADKVTKYPNIPDYQPDVELKKQINLQFLKPEQIQNYNADKFIQSKKQFRQVLVNALPADFKKRFDEGLKSYLGGKWSDAKLHNDGPTKRLLSYMKNYDFVAPSNWNNYRQLTSK